VVIAQLDEGPQWWAEVLGADPDRIAAGVRLSLCLEPAGDHEVVPAFRLA